MKVDVLSLENKKVGQAELADSVFGVEVCKDTLHRMVTYQLARRRGGTRKVLERGEVQGSTAKIYRQKGTGRARHSTRKANIFRGGGVVHGPRVRSHVIGLPKKVRRRAMRCALSAKIAEGGLVVIDTLRVTDAKTKILAGRLQGLGLASVLLIDGPEIDPGFARASANIPGVDVLPVQGANVYDILRHEKLVLVPKAIQEIEERLA